MVRYPTSRKPRAAARARSRARGRSEPRSRTFSFTLLIEGPDLLAPEHLDALHEAGLGDATFGRRGVLGFADFDREGSSLGQVVLEAMRAVECAVPGAQVVRVEPDDLVSAATIAERTGRTRESVRLLITGERGRGGFPPPLAWVDAKTRVWRWSDVAAWLGGGQPAEGVAPEVADAELIAALNGVLEARKHLDRLEEAGAPSALLTGIAGLVAEGPGRRGAPRIGVARSTGGAARAAAADESAPVRARRPHDPA